MIKIGSAVLMAFFYFVAGLNHFVNPALYLPLIPDYLLFPHIINYTSGLIEVVLGLGILYPKTRSKSALAIIALLVLFIPSHIHFIKIGGCISQGLCFPQWVAWVRLIVIHPLFMFWAYLVSKK